MWRRRATSLVAFQEWIDAGGSSHKGDLCHGSSVLLASRGNQSGWTLLPSAEMGKARQVLVSRSHFTDFADQPADATQRFAAQRLRLRVCTLLSNKHLQAIRRVAASFIASRRWHYLSLSLSASHPICCQDRVLGRVVLRHVAGVVIHGQALLPGARLTQLLLGYRHGFGKSLSQGRLRRCRVRYGAPRQHLSVVYRRSLPYRAFWA